jgi:trafficking protein particle complex subunit 6
MAFEPAAALPTSNDPTATYVNASCFEYLLIELVPMAFRLEAERALCDEEGSGSSKPVPNGSAANGTDTEVEQRETRAAAGLGIGGIGGTAPGIEEDELRESVGWRLDALGYRVGQGLAERYGKNNAPPAAIYIFALSSSSWRLKCIPKHTS